MEDAEIRDIMVNVDKLLAASSQFKAQRIRWSLTSTTNTIKNEEVALHISLIGKSGAPISSATLLPQSTVLEVLYNSDLFESDHEANSRTVETVLFEKLQEIFAEELSMITHIMASNPGYSQLAQSQSTALGDKLEPTELTQKLAGRRTRSLKYAPTYHISISLFSPGAVPKTWDIEAAILEYLTPLLQSFSTSNFTVDTQLQLYASFSPTMNPPEYDSTTQQWTLREEDLSSFINPAEWPLSPNIGDGPTINFVLYIPEETQRPLVVKGSSASSWIVPQWGGISILNPVGSVGDHLPKDQIRPALLTFSHQLLSLLGASDSIASFRLQIQTLTRLHAISLMLSASSTLGSLAKLSESLSTIPIPDHVLSRVQRGLSHLEKTCASLQTGNVREALEHARLAKAEAEKAFFEKDMVSQVYFPDEHKVAVYLPLLGPMGVTLLTSLFREVKRRRATVKAG